MTPPSFTEDNNSLAKVASKSALNDVESAIEYVKTPYQNKTGSFPLQAAAEKISLLHRAVDAVNTLLQQRRELRNDIRSEISSELCELRSLQYELENAGADSSAGISLRRHISDLSKEQRRHEVEFFRDTCMLLRELRKSESEFMIALLPFYSIAMGNYCSTKKK